MIKTEQEVPSPIQPRQPTPEELVKFAIGVALSPNSSPAERERATLFCKGLVVKVDSPVELCEIGLRMIAHRNVTVAKTGMSFVGRATRYHWQDIQQDPGLRVRVMTWMTNHRKLREQAQAQQARRYYIWKLKNTSSQ